MHLNTQTFHLPLSKSLNSFCLLSVRLCRVQICLSGCLSGIRSVLYWDCVCDSDYARWPLRYQSAVAVSDHKVGHSSRSFHRGSFRAARRRIHNFLAFDCCRVSPALLLLCWCFCLPPFFLYLLLIISLFKLHNTQRIYSCSWIKACHVKSWLDFLVGCGHHNGGRFTHYLGFHVKDTLLPLVCQQVLEKAWFMWFLFACCP